ncbi:MAG: KTSC domain-containing protein [Verrucomicrobia bacterium]|nr:KTSC domain-containing protein [Verrucomicrobiota bacterium]MBU1910571.1 KTSC domain-containing protein [Verrucomicrobiota bacterium]
MSRWVWMAGAVLAAGLLVAPVLAEEVVLQDVESTLVQQVGYDPATQTLTVKLVTDGSVYEYFGVPQEVYDQFMAAESKGNFFSKNIKNVYKFQKKQ